MTRTARLLLLTLLTVVGLLSGTLTPASAGAPGYVAIHNQGDSGLHLDVAMVVQASGASYEINLLPGDTAGEPGYLYSNSEPVSFYNRAGWCSKFWNESGVIKYLYAQSYGYWWNIYPGSDFTGRTLVRVKTWNC